ncbi:MAG: Asd/ArgC dimerization domain-containing protein, partial [Peptoniphilaceae bacterium]|nr:Asd/ArgC dimerization domain-containing protein [Peptoniphilaceae bacterium]
KEEMKMIDETRKILHLPELAVTATAVRVPVDFGHSISVNVELENEFSLEDVRHAMQKQDGIVLADDPENLIYPYPELCKGNDAIYIGRIRRDESCSNALNFFCVADNIRKGAATNSVQIAELLVRGRL